MRFFFCRAEDGIRDRNVTGVQTCALPIYQVLKQILGPEQTMEDLDPDKRGEILEVVEDMGETCDLEVLVLVDTSASMHDKLPMEIGRASCREGVQLWVMRAANSRKSTDSE